jgi:hypothetical protein
MEQFNQGFFIGNVALLRPNRGQNSATDVHGRIGTDRHVDRNDQFGSIITADRKKSGLEMQGRAQPFAEALKLRQTVGLSLRRSLPQG